MYEVQKTVRMIRILAITSMLLLSGCTFAGLPTEEWDTELLGVPVHYRISQGKVRGSSVVIFGQCTIALNTNLSSDERILVAAHEVGHCFDGTKLGWSSNQFGDAGCEYGSYYCSPREGYAEAYARAYILGTCGWAASPLGLQPGDGKECDLPDPHSVRPESRL